MQLSDIHVGHHRGGKYLEKIVEETNRRKPDIVFITGDLIDSEAAFVPAALDPLARFSAPVYYVGGNHEKYVDAERAFALVKKHGVNVLRNQVVETHGLQLVGLDYMNADEDTFDLHPSDDSRTIKSVLASLHLKDGMPSVLMQHSPAGAQYAAAKGIDLMIAGHTHGQHLLVHVDSCDSIRHRPLLRERRACLIASVRVASYRGFSPEDQQRSIIRSITHAPDHTVARPRWLHG